MSTIVNKQKDLISRYEKNLEKVKQVWGVDNCKTSFEKEKGQEYIAYAENALKEVKNGRNW
jgi:hypothetical protein